MPFLRESCAFLTWPKAVKDKATKAAKEAKEAAKKVAKVKAKNAEKVADEAASNRKAKTKKFEKWRN